MAFRFANNPESVPLHKLFPAEYAATKRMIVRDFAFLAACIVLAIVGMALLYA